MPSASVESSSIARFASEIACGYASPGGTKTSARYVYAVASPACARAWSVSSAIA